MPVQPFVNPGQLVQAVTCRKKHKNPCDLDVWSMTLIFNGLPKVVKAQNFIELSAAVCELSCWQSFDDAENNTAVASAGSANDSNKRRRSTDFCLAFCSWSTCSVSSLTASCCFLRSPAICASLCSWASSKSRRSFCSSASRFLFRSIWTHRKPSLTTASFTVDWLTGLFRCNKRTSTLDRNQNKTPQKCRNTNTY